MGIRADLRRGIHDAQVNVVASAGLGIPSFRLFLLRLSGLRIGSGTKIHGKCWFGGTNVSIGENCWINYGVTFDNAAGISIASDCLIGPQVLFVTSSHEMGPSERRGGDPTAGPIVVGSGCWIGARVTILPGVTVGNGCVIAAGAVVTSDCLPNTLYAGVPARAQREL
ncbi:DapH/DapD/GlmU-related protein [Paenarthrobacter aurescens]|jgi:acetyltransferase-like isoleucine patch superfamily enzyme|uniref:acyltransferase n=1 Tax=Paenarthrobacter aurescens TaxID=43663 RepID=UPI000306B0DD